MLTKPRAEGKPEGDARPAHSPAIDVALRADYFAGVRHPRPSPSLRTPEICHLVFLPFCSCGHRHRLADVSFFPLKNTFFRRPRQIFSANVIISKLGRGSSVVEQPIRNRQVASSTLALGSIFLKTNQIALRKLSAAEQPARVTTLWAVASKQ